MKKHIFLLLLMVSIMMCGCLKDIEVSPETTYTGCVKSRSNAPISNVRVVVAHSYNNYGPVGVIYTTYTDAWGNFEFKLNSNSFPHGAYQSYSYNIYFINGNVYAENTLQGVGEKTFDYGTIIIN